MDWHIKIRAWSLAIPLILIAFSAFVFPGNKEYWIFLLVVAMITGYVHFFVGTFYQVRSINHNIHKRKLFIAFVIIAAISFVIGKVLIENGYSIPLGMFTLVYFMLHVLLNEHTFLNQTQYKVSYPLMLSLLLLFTPPFFISLAHPPFYYSFDLVYPPLNILEQAAILHSIISFEVLQGVSIFMGVLFLLCAPVIFYQRFGFKAALVATIAGLVTILAVATNQPINFVFMVHGVLMFHFILMSLIFYKPIKNKGSAFLHEYIKLHLYVLIPLLIIVSLYYIPILNGAIVNDLFSSIFNFGNFLVISLTHISVSFLNEPWFKKYTLGIK